MVDFAVLSSSPPLKQADWEFEHLVQREVFCPVGTVDFHPDLCSWILVFCHWTLPSRPLGCGALDLCLALSEAVHEAQWVVLVLCVCLVLGHGAASVSHLLGWFELVSGTRDVFSLY